MQIARYPLTLEHETVQVGTAKELIIVLDVVGDSYDRIVLEQLRSHLAHILSDPNDLALLITSLTPENQLYLLDALGPALANCFREARYLVRFLATTRESQVEAKTLATLGTDGLQTLIITSEDLVSVLQWLDSSNGSQLLNLLGSSFLNRLIKSGIGLSYVLDTLDTASQENLLTRLEWEKVVQVVRDTHDLAHLLRALSQRDSTHLLQHFTRQQLLTIIGDADDWQYLNERISGDTAQQLYRKLNVSTQGTDNGAS